MVTKRIILKDYLALYQNSIALYSDIEAPIPEINNQSIKNIKYILEVPFQSVFGKVAYWGFHKKAAIMFYLMIKNHPLENGNKRLACMCLVWFYEINKRQLKLNDKDLYNLSRGVAISDANESELGINAINQFLKAIK